MMMHDERQTISQVAAHSRPLRRVLGWSAYLTVIAGVCFTFAWLNRPEPQRASAGPVWFEAGKKESRAATSTPQVAPAAISAEDKTRALGQLARVDRVLREYRRAYGEFPVGSNADITRALRGDNQKKIIFVTENEASISARGEILDAWQTPYFFHQLSGTRMEIISAGPDRRMWTADDLKVTAN